MPSELPTKASAPSGSMSIGKGSGGGRMSLRALCMASVAMLCQVKNAPTAVARTNMSKVKVAKPSDHSRALMKLRGAVSKVTSKVRIIVRKADDDSHRPESMKTGATSTSANAVTLRRMNGLNSSGAKSSKRLPSTKVSGRLRRMSDVV